MEIIADIFLIAGAIGAAFYCVVLSRRLNRLNDLEKGVGGAIAALSSQVNDMTQTISRAQQSASESASTLSGLTERGENVARRLELLVASMHDLPTETFADKSGSEQIGGATMQPGVKSNKNGSEVGSLFRSARKENVEVAI